MASWLWPGDLTSDTLMFMAALALDAILPRVPTALHPVGWMGAAIRLLERALPMNGRLAPLGVGGVITLLTVVGTAAVVAWVGVKLWDAGALAYALVGAVLLKSTFEVKGLRRPALATARNLEAGDLVGARRGLGALVSRDPAGLGVAQASGAVIESVAENTTDSYIGPWLAFAFLGLPGAFAYRAINTLDSMLGYRGRYEYVGKIPALLDDLINLAPARLGAALMLVGGWLAGLPADRGLRVMRADRGRTASPNAGWTMAAMAGLLGVRLEKRGEYVLGEGLADPRPSDIRRAVSVALVVAFLGASVGVGILALRHALV